MIIRNFTDPRILGAACATAKWITARSNTAYKQVVVSVLNGTYQVIRLLKHENIAIYYFVQVVNGLKYDLVIELALSMICDRNSPECFVSDCPIDDRTRMLWMTSVVASPAPQPTYSVLSVSQIHSVVSDCCHS